MVAIAFLTLALLAADEPQPKVPVGEATTVVTGPLTKEGYIDYEAALNERLGKGVTPETNANVLIWKALGPRPGGRHASAAFFKYLGVEEPPEQGDYLLGVAEWLRQEGGDDPADAEKLQAALGLACRRPWTAKDEPRLAAWLTANDKPLATVVAASRRTGYYNPLVVPRGGREPGVLLSALHPGVQECRVAADALAARVMLRLGDGKVDDAWQDLVACHRLGRLVARGGTLIEFLVGVAINDRAAEAGVVLIDRAGDAKQARAWLADLRNLPAMPSVADKVDLAERFGYLDAAQFMRRGGAIDDVDLAAEAAMAQLDWGPIFRDGNRWYDRSRDAAQLPTRAERVRAFAQIDADLRALKPKGDPRLALAWQLLGGTPVEKLIAKKVGDALIGLTLPAVDNVQTKADRAEQTHRNLLVAFALSAHRREHGRFPEKLDALAPAHPPIVPGDLFSGGNLVYRPDGDGFLLYSVGVDGKDNGGRMDGDDLPGDDLRVRLPLPKK